MMNLRLRAFLLLHCITIALFILFILPSSAHAVWSIQGVDTPKTFEYSSSRSIAIDKNGDPHIVYGKDHLYHAYLNGTQWVYETVDKSPGVGQYASIAIDANGKIHISYWDSTNGDLKYATNILGVWQSITLDSGNVGMYTSIAIDSSNKVHISYYDYLNLDLKYATNTSGNWGTATVDSTGYVGSATSIAIDSSSKAHISYYDTTNGGLKYATNASGSWVTTTVDSIGYIGTTISIAIDSSNKAHISYYYGLVNDEDLKYATNASGSWVTTTVDSEGRIGEYSSIAIDSSSKVHISYCDYTNRDLKYATNASGSWVTTTVDSSGWAGVWSSIAIDSSNKAHISHVDYKNFELKYATNASGDWVTTTVDNAGGVGRFTSIAIDSSNKVHISYGYFAYGDLKYATNASGSWVTTTVDSTAGGGSYSSIAIDSSKAHISYLDHANMDLKYATNASGSWVTTTVDSEGRIGEYSSIAIDSSSKVHISYCDYTNRDLKYATNASGSWVTTTVDSEGIVGEHTSIAIDSSNMKYISYYDGTNGDLKYATNASGSWVTTTVDSEGDVGWYTSIAIDSSNKAHISYFDFANYDLKYATNAPIDITPPVGTISINNYAVYTNDNTVTLTLTCGDLQGACSEMQFSNNGASWSTPETYAASWPSWDITAAAYGGNSADGTKYVYARFKDSSGNWSNAFSDSIILDETYPSTTPSPSGGLSEASQNITLTCVDGGSGCAHTYSCTGAVGSGCNPTIPYTYSAEITISEDTDLRFYSVDSLGNVEPVKTETYTLVHTATSLSLELSAPRILSGGTVEAVGQLLRIPENSASRNGMTIRFEITGPSPVPPETETTTYTDSGLYSKTISGFIAEGTYTIKAVFDGNGVLLPDESTEMSVYVGPSAGYAIIVEGKIPSEEGLASHNKTTNRIYTKLKDRGFNDSEIYYFNYNTGQTGVDEAPTKTAIQNAVEQWAKFKMNDIAAPLYIIMADHGDATDGFYIFNNGNNETITPDDMNTWLDNLEAGLNAPALTKNRYIIIGACYSGSYIPVISKTGRAIITSSAENEISYKGPYENDSGTQIRSGEFFLEELFTYLERGETIKDAFTKATEKTEVFTRKDDLSANSGYPYYDNSVQHPMMDTNADGTGSNALSTGGDGEEVSDQYLGVGNYYVPNRTTNPAEITAVTETVFLTDAEADTTHTMWANVNNDAKIDGGRIWFEVRPPSTTLSGTGGSGQLEANYTYNFLLQNGTQHWQKTYPTFDQSGKYEIFYFVRDSATQKVSPMKRSIVYKDSPANTSYPNSFNLLSPFDSGAPSAPPETRTELLLQWEESGDLSGKITYTVKISENSNFSTIKYIREEIEQSATIIGSEAGLEDLKTYYWKVESIDPYGKKRASNQASRFRTNNGGNPTLPIFVTGHVNDAATKLPIEGAAVIVNGMTPIKTDSNGVYVSTVTANTVTVSVTNAGYVPNIMSVTVPSGTSYIEVNVLLTPIQYTITGTVTSGNGLSGVKLSGTGASCSSTDGSGNYSCTVNSGFSGTITPSKAGYTFSPASRNYSNVSSNQTAENYTASIQTRTITGSLNVIGVTLTGSGASCTSTTNSYTCTVNYGWSGTITPSKAGYDFSPANRTYSNVTSNQTSQNYTATIQTRTITGSLNTSGVTLTGSAASCTSTTNSYTCTVNYGWSGTITPSKSNYTFSPASRSYSNITSNQSNQDYTGTLGGPGAFNKLFPSNGVTGQSTNPALNWDSSSGAVSYDYCYDTRNNSTCDTGWTSTGSNTSVTLSGLYSGTLYYWQVRANNAGGTTYANSGTWWSFTTQVGSTIKLPDTGQTKCYRGISPYDEIPCAGTGQDGAYSINPMNFSIIGSNNDMVQDNNTGLIWQRQDDGNTYNWYQASGTYDTTYNPSSQNICGDLTTGGYTDWRMPTKKELITIVDYSIAAPGPTTNTTYFPNTKSEYWLSTPHASFPDGAWYVDFDYGELHYSYKSDSLYVRCVRGAESSPSFTDNLNGTVTDNRTSFVWQQSEGGYMSWTSALSYCDGLSL